MAVDRCRQEVPMATFISIFGGLAVFAFLALLVVRTRRSG
jgi:hypothetical protein